MSSRAAQSLGPLLRYLPYQNFNKVQEAVIPALFTNDRNCLIAAPTGSGKTALLEVAMLRLFRHRLLSSAAADCNVAAQDERAHRNPKHKAVYICPIKALANEKYEHWRTQFPSLSVVIETGDQMQQREMRHKGASDDSSTAEPPTSTAEDMSTVSQANILVTTPERWDSITRRWKEKEVMAIVNSVGLLLLDEVHTVQEERGAAMEAIVSRVKAIQAATAHDAVNCAATRIVAISGTLPNIGDMAEWLEVSPEMTFAFSAADRPVPLTIKVVSYAHDSANPFAFHRFLSFKLFSLVQQFSEGMPTLVFCTSRKEVTSTALQLIEDIRGAATRRGQLAQLQPSEETHRLAEQASDKQLRSCLLSGVGFHHAAMTTDDRLLVERMFREQYIVVVCSTTTLALGVNLPAHLVVIKGTTFFATGQCQDMSVSEVMQMCGRAGRPGLDAHGVALVLTTQRKAHIYDTLRNGAVTLTCVESHLHRHMVEHVNAEVALRTIQSFHSALEWAKTTFFWIRLRKCPRHYGLEFANKSEEDEFDAEAFMEALMERVLRVLVEEGCISIGQSTRTVGEVRSPFPSEVENAAEHGDSSFSTDSVLGDVRQPGVVFEPTRLGRAMSRMYVLFDTVCVLNAEMEKRGAVNCRGGRDSQQQQKQPAGDFAASASIARSTEAGEDGEGDDVTAADLSEHKGSAQPKTQWRADSTAGCTGAAPFTLQEALRLLCHCQELVAVRLRQGDRGPLNEINRAVRFPLHSGRRGGREVREEWHKVYLLIQASVGLLPITEVSLRNDAARLWSVVPRVSRFLEEYAWARTSSYSLVCGANLLARCMERRVWPDGPVLRQLPHVNDAVAKSLLRGGCGGFDALRRMDARRLEVLCSRLPPFGNQVLSQVSSLPQLEVELSIDGLNKTAVSTLKGSVGENGVGTVRVFFLRFPPNGLTGNSGNSPRCDAPSTDLRGAGSADMSKRQGTKWARTESAVRGGCVLLVVGALAADVVLLKRFVPLSPASPSSVGQQQWCSGGASRQTVEDAADRIEVASFTFHCPLLFLRGGGVPDARRRIEARCFVLHMVGLDVIAQVCGETADADVRLPVVTSSTTVTASASLHTPTLDQYCAAKPPLQRDADSMDEENKKRQMKRNAAVTTEELAASAQIVAEARDSFKALLADMTYVASDDKRVQKRQTNRERKRPRSDAGGNAKDPAAAASASKWSAPTLQSNIASEKGVCFSKGDAGTDAAAGAVAEKSVAEKDTSAAANAADTCPPERGLEERGKTPSASPLRQPRTEVLHRPRQSPARIAMQLPTESEAGCVFDSENEQQAGQATPSRPSWSKARESGVAVRLPRCTSPPATRPVIHHNDSRLYNNNLVPVDEFDPRYHASHDVDRRQFRAGDAAMFQRGPSHPASEEMNSYIIPRWQWRTNAAPPGNHAVGYPPSENGRLTVRPNFSCGLPANFYEAERCCGRGYENAGPRYSASVEPRGFTSGPSEANAYFPGVDPHMWGVSSVMPAGWPPHPYSHGSGAEWQYSNVPYALSGFPSETHFPGPHRGMTARPHSGSVMQRPPQPAYNDWTQSHGNAQWSTVHRPSTPPTPPLSFPQTQNWENTLPRSSHDQTNAPSVRHSVPRHQGFASYQPSQLTRHVESKVRSFSAARSYPNDVAVIAPPGLSAAHRAMPRTQQTIRNLGRAPSSWQTAAPSAGSGTFTSHVRRSAMVSQSWWQ
ncbi:putative DEAD/DEAH box helicase-like protein [Leptomonas pyrrhocoris]|uniref:DNA 3'-5' helicase n=1 Tax=Leptomonas pyrrhocoris TaxID=157538 RepID=A0A0M9G8J7_LEPPY|nr:putative DEAD/DEAH box helicase-like protein [Leptomonas pyrrhocoris]KPA84679.1 putative DEAD/DEAH box helicase-like protein [Leptomonas pyrrhocoris]|eukprot:XP_015663118.1 putative DEAD/DEAH box helicase-like protein [Leptomonas pyrrhocoris]